MFQQFTQTMGPWTWVTIGLLALMAEIFLPGVYLIWFGLAAITTGLVSLALWNQSVWIWQVQFLSFALLSLVYVLAARRYMKSDDNSSDQPHLNNREASMIGRTATLIDAIENGYGRIRLEDSVWRVSGADAPAGSRVMIVGANSQILQVELIAEV